VRNGIQTSVTAGAAAGYFREAATQVLSVTSLAIRKIHRGDKVTMEVGMPARRPPCGMRNGTHSGMTGCITARQSRDSSREVAPMTGLAGRISVCCYPGPVKICMVRRGPTCWVGDSAAGRMADGIAAGCLCPSAGEIGTMAGITGR
jgi:hypothetical protein